MIIFEQKKFINFQADYLGFSELEQLRQKSGDFELSGPQWICEIWRHYYKHADDVDRKKSSKKF